MTNYASSWIKSTKTLEAPKMKTLRLKLAQPIYVGLIQERTTIRTGEEYYTIDVYTENNENAEKITLPCTKECGLFIIKNQGKVFELTLEFRDYTFIKKASKGCVLWIIQAKLHEYEIQ